MDPCTKRVGQTGHRTGRIAGALLYWLEKLVVRCCWMPANSRAVLSWQFAALQRQTAVPLATCCSLLGLSTGGADCCRV
jgi:hypothetical protein